MKVPCLHCKNNVLTCPGRPAESSGVMPGDFIVSVNQTDVTTLTHFELVSIIKQCGAEGDMALGICRGISQGVFGRRGG